MLINIMFTVAVGTDGGVGISFCDSHAMDALGKFAGFAGVAFSAGFGDMDLIHLGSRVKSFLHLVAAVAIDAVCGPGVSAIECAAVDALLVRRDKLCRRGCPCPDIGVIEMARQAELFLGGFGLKRIAPGIIQGDGILMAGEAVGGAFHAGGKRLAMLGDFKVIDNIRVAFAARPDDICPVEL